jgi:hypothetical protein
LDCGLSIYASGLARIIGVFLCAQLVGWGEVLLTFSLGWPHNPPYFHFLCSWDYRREVLCLAPNYIILKQVSGTSSLL